MDIYTSLFFSSSFLHLCSVQLEYELNKNLLSSLMWLFSLNSTGKEPVQWLI